MHNPFGFTKQPVTLVICAVYIGLFASLLYVHHVVPSAPVYDSFLPEIDVSEAWRDLQELTNGFHPYNSHRNDHVRDWLLRRIEAILDDNKINFDIEQSYGLEEVPSLAKETAPVVIFNDMLSNVTTSANSTLTAPLSVYFEGTNIIVYVKGSDEDNRPWWRTKNPNPPNEKRAVLVNAHYDSVSTGFGATDDGVGVVSILQLIKYFTTAGNQPKRGLVALFNNGEEDYLNGAWAYMQHPISKLTDSFLNLEGAGAGGRAALFRTTDAEVTRYYRKSPYPFASVVTADGFKRGLVRSQTDYVVFNGVGGMRGLDVAFLEPRARYHTNEDSTKQTSRDSLWHMLSAAIATTKALTADTHTDLSPSAGSDGVWFDVYGKGFALMKLHSLFALSVTLLVVAPLTIALLLLALRHMDKQYLFTANHVTDPLDPHTPDEATVIGLGGWKGFTRFPIAFVVATAVVTGMALGLAKANPYIVYSSPYAVWSMMLSAWASISWFFLRGASFMRPSALQRAHSLTWLFILLWLALVVATVGEHNYGLGSGYFVVIYFAAVFVALATSYSELFFLPKKTSFVQRYFPVPEYSDDSDAAGRSRSRGRRGRPAALASTSEPEDANETTSLLSNRPRKRVIGGRSEAEQPADGNPTQTAPGVFGEEQSWSETLPSWLWIIQFLLVAPIVLILVGQIALLLTSALAQTLADGSSALNVYLCMAGLSVLILLPASPFVHRFNRKVPFFLLLVCIGTLIYNLAAFPFSQDSRLKVYFLQKIDVETGINRVFLTGVPEHIEAIVQELPSSAEQQIECSEPDVSSRRGLMTCNWEGLSPDVVPKSVQVAAKQKSKTRASSSRTSSHSKSSRSTSRTSSAQSSPSAPPTPSPTLQPGPNPLPPPMRYKHYMSLKTNRTSASSATFTISGRNTRACKLLFNSPIHKFTVRGAAERYNDVPHIGTSEVRLWSRNWDREWIVDVEWDAQRWQDEPVVDEQKTRKNRGLDGTAVCMWSEQSPSGLIPALDEVLMFAPKWVAVTKYSDGLLEGTESFVV